MFGLYGDLPAAKNTSGGAPVGAAAAGEPAAALPAAAGWAADAAALRPPPALARAALAKPAASMTPPPALLRARLQQQPRPPAGGGGGAPSTSGPAPQTAPFWRVPEAPSAEAPSVSHAVAGAGGSLSAVVREEYDPARPNDYETWRRERSRRERAREAAALREREREREERTREREREREQARMRDGSSAAAPAATAARAEALSVSGEEAYLRRARLSGMPAPRPPSPPPGEGEDVPTGPSPAPSGGGGLSLAERMMLKMGWREGQGLGKQEQGITAPLVARKTDARSGVIVVGKQRAAGAPAAPQFSTPGAPERRPSRGLAAAGAPTPVVLLRNMVGPGEVDTELHAEVAGECGKYGTVGQVHVFEVQAGGVAPEEAVRIFVQFSRVEQATKAVIDLDGRYFGGRDVRASFFDLDRFAVLDLAPREEELIEHMGN